MTSIDAKEKNRQRSLEYYHKNKEKKRQYYIDNQEKMKEYNKKYYQKNKKTIIINSLKRKGFEVPENAELTSFSVKPFCQNEINATTTKNAP